MMTTLLQRLATTLVSHPPVYRLVQNLAGQARVADRIRRVFPIVSGRAAILDLGSSEGTFSTRLAIDPIFLDIDATPLLALRRRRQGSRAVAADASSLPFPDAAFEVSLCVAICHHLDDAALDAMVSELSRVTRGHLVLLDPIRNDARTRSRWLWRFDRGRHPRTRAELESVLQRRFRLNMVEEFAIHHEYVLCVASPSKRE